MTSKLTIRVELVNQALKDADLAKAIRTTADEQVAGEPTSERIATVVSVLSSELELTLVEADELRKQANARLELRTFKVRVAQFDAKVQTGPWTSSNGRYTVTEFASGFEATDHQTGACCWLGDGVDWFRDLAGQAVPVGTPEWGRCCLAWLDSLDADEWHQLLWS